MQIFISYSKTRDQVAALAQDLETLGHDVWFDAKELAGGQDWWQEILSQIAGCDLFIFALSPQSLLSYPCQLEYTYAADVKKRILPVLLADVQVALLPPPLSRLHYVDYRTADRQAVLALSRALGSLPPAEALPNPLPTPPEAPISPLSKLSERLNDPTMLTLPDQAALLLELKSVLRNRETASPARELLVQFKRRHDLYATISDEIDVLLVTGVGIAIPGPKPQTGPLTPIVEPLPKTGPLVEPKPKTGPLTPEAKVEAYLNALEVKMQIFGFASAGSPKLKATALHSTYHRRQMELVVQVDSVCMICAPQREVTVEFVKTYSPEALKASPQVKSGLPVGWGRLMLLYAVIVAYDFSPEVRRFVREVYHPEHTSEHECPVLVEIATGEVYFYPPRLMRIPKYESPKVEIPKIFKPE